MMDMHIKKVALVLISLLALAVFCGCDAMDSFLSSGGAYKINACVGEVPLNECSFIALNDEITPFFEEFVSKDPDITSLVISIANAEGELLDWMAVYSLKKETEQYEEAEQVESLDAGLPFFKLPDDLPMGFYSMVFRVMGGKDTLQRTEKDFFYLGDAVFSFEGIDFHLPGISDNQQLVSRGQVVLLEAKLNFDKRLDPYIVWYSGKNKIAEGSYSEGTSLLLWKAPEHSNFYPLSAEVFPVNDFDTLAGYNRSHSVLVSSNTVDVNLISENADSLVNWYVFEGNLNDSKTPIPIEARSIQPSENNIITNAKRHNVNWLPVNGTYGLATGYGNVFTLPNIFMSAGRGSWQLLFRFMPLDKGSILSINFGASSNVVMDLSIDEKNIVLTLSSALSIEKVTQVYDLPLDQRSFITMGVSFAVIAPSLGLPGFVTAKVNVLGETIEEGELALEPLRLEANVVNEFQISLGKILKETSAVEQDDVDNTQEQEETVNYVVPYFTALWDEFALYNNPSMELIAQEIKSVPVVSAQIYE